MQYITTLLHKRAFYYVLLCIMFSSCKPSSSRWHAQQTTGAFVPYQSKRLYLASDKTCPTADIEILRVNGEEQMFINIYSLPVPPSKQDEKKSEGLLKLSKNEPYPILMDRLEGGQRLIVSKKERKQILKNLSEGNEGILLIDRYTINLSPNGFNKVYLN